MWSCMCLYQRFWYWLYGFTWHLSWVDYILGSYSLSQGPPFRMACLGLCLWEMWKLWCGELGNLSNSGGWIIIALISRKHFNMEIIVIKKGEERKKLKLIYKSTKRNEILHTWSQSCSILFVTISLQGGTTNSSEIALRVFQMTLLFQ